MYKRDRKEMDRKLSEKYRSKIREMFMGEDWDVFLTLNFRKYIPLDEGSKKVDMWDGLVSKRMVGRRYNLDKNFYRRMSFVGSGGYNGKNQLHYHLLVKLPPSWKVESNVSEFRKLVEFYFPQVGGSRVDEEGFQTIGKTEEDRRKVVWYITNPRNLPINDEGKLDTDVMIFSRNHGMKF